MNSDKQQLALQRLEEEKPLPLQEGTTQTKTVRKNRRMEVKSMEACKSKNSICMGEVAKGEIVEVGRLRTMVSSRKARYRPDWSVVVCNPTHGSKKFPFICIKNNFLHMLKLKHL